MQKHGLGNEQAVLALTMSSAVRNRLDTGAKNEIFDVSRALRGLIEGVRQAPSSPVESKDTAGQDSSKSLSISLPHIKIQNEKQQQITKTLGEKKTNAVAHSNKTKCKRKLSLETPVGSPEGAKRMRADSVSEEASAKEEEASAAATRSVSTEAKVKATPLVRSKRSRNMEDVAEGHVVALSATKRARKGSA